MKSAIRLAENTKESWCGWSGERGGGCCEDMSGSDHAEPWRTHQIFFPYHESSGSSSRGFKLESEMSRSLFEKLTLAVV